MLDIKLIRETPEIVRQNLIRRGMDTDTVDTVLNYDEEWRKNITEGNALKKRKNEISLEIGVLKRDKKNASHLISEMGDISKKIGEADRFAEEYKGKRDYLLMRLPNILHESVPTGEGEEGNEVMREWGERRQFSFTPRSHVDLLDILDVADLERGAKVAGARFYYLKNELVRLDLAIQKFALDYMVEKGFTPIYPPLMIKRKAYEGVTDLADFEDVLYKIDNEDLYLIATSEHPMGAMHMDELFEKKQLPLRYAGISPCFRKEAGAHGKDTKGIFRVHVFNKIEQFVFCTPETSWKEHEGLIANGEELVRRLGLPYNITNICTGDIGTVAAKKYDVNVFFSVQGAYREVISCSNCTDYQARRLNIRYREHSGAETVCVHTLNSTALATGRIMVAILENFQNEDGSVNIPEVLWPWSGFEKIERKS